MEKKTKPKQKTPTQQQKKSLAKKQQHRNEITLTTNQFR